VPAPGDFANHRLCSARIFARREESGGFRNIDQVMRNTLAFGRNDLGGADVKAAVNLQRIIVDDLPSDGARDPKGQIAFT
jgi:hypothetical protein